MTTSSSLPFFALLKIAVFDQECKATREGLLDLELEGF